MDQFERLFSIIRKLRSDEGCPWDREQSTRTMVPSLIEETYETVEAIEKGTDADLEEELGDLMFLTLFVGYMGEQEKRLTVENMIKGAADKLVRRHPHVFGTTDVENVDEIIRNWETIKRAEKKNEHRKTPFDGIPKGLPAIQRFNKIVDKAGRAGFHTKKTDKKDVIQAGNAYFKKSTGKNLEIYMESMLNYMHQKKIDLSKTIRDISDRKIKEFTSNDPKSSHLKK
jgi:MazG family protein